MKALDLDPNSQADLEKLRDPSKIPWESITKVIEDLIPYGTFRGCTDGTFIPPNSMDHQASPSFASSLKAKGIKYIVVGDLSEEWYLYSIAHPITTYESIGKNLKRYYPDGIVDRIMAHYGDMRPDSTEEEFERMFGLMLSEGQGEFGFAASPSFFLMMCDSASTCSTTASRFSEERIPSR